MKKPAISPTFFPYLTLLMWVLPLVLVRSGQISLMAHDEGIYAVQAKAILETGDWLAPQWAGEVGFDRTIGIQWLIALCYQWLGMTEEAVRLPSSVGFVAIALLLLRIGTLTMGQRLGWLGAAIFAVTPLAAHYARLGTQDMVLTCLEVAAVWGLLEGERRGRNSLWLMLTGVCFGWGFLIKGFMVIPAAIALVPYLLLENKRHGHLRNLWLYGGMVLGMVPVVGWLWAAVAKYGDRVGDELLGKLLHLRGQTYQGAGPFYYFWNIPANGFPWAILGAVGAWWGRRAVGPYFWLLVGAPFVLFGELCLFGTKTPYYPLQLMPWLGLLAAVVVESRGRWLRWCFGLLGGLVGLGAVAGIVGWRPAGLPMEMAQGSVLMPLLMAILGLSWLGASLCGTKRLWLGGLLVGPWVVLMLLNGGGVLGDYEPQLKAFVTEHRAEIAACRRVSFVVDEAQLSRQGRKEYLLLNFYTPHLGDYYKVLPPRLDECAWVDPNWAQALSLGTAIYPGGWRWLGPGKMPGIDR